MNVKTKRLGIRAAVAALTAAACALLLAQTSGGFRFFGPLSRIITPNGDGVNDYAILCVDNPSASGVEGKVFTLMGAEVSSLTGPLYLNQAPQGGPTPVACPAGMFSGVPGSAQYLYWDGRSDGGAVHSGVYVYEVKAEGQAFTGTLLVVR